VFRGWCIATGNQNATILMKTTLLELDTKPSDQEISTLLGKNVFSCYLLLCKAIVSLLSPDTELWDQAGRRGKYFHGYRIEKRAIVVDLYLLSVDDQGICKCEFKINRRCFEKIRKQMNTFCQKVQDSVQDAMEFKKNYGGTYLSLIVNDDNIQDVLKIVSILS
jgi:hypothetical protein